MISNKLKLSTINCLLAITVINMNSAFAVEFNSENNSADNQYESSANESYLPVEINANDPSIQAIDKVQTMPAPIYEANGDAEDKINRFLNQAKIKIGWDETKKIYIAQGIASFDSEDPSYDDSFIIKRSMKTMEAILSAKAEIIEYINTTMSAEDNVDIPGTDLYSEFNEQKEKNKKKLHAQKMKLAKLLDDVDKKMADELRGVTFSDRYNAYMDAAIKKLDDEYSTKNIEEKKQSSFKKAKERYQSAQNELIDLEIKIKNSQGKTTFTSKSQVETTSKMPLFGSITAQQFESWDQDSERYKVALLVMWSPSTEKMARSMITGEKLSLPPSEPLQSWVQKQDWSTMTGGRRVRDEHGDGWFIGVEARAVGSSSASERKARGIADMFAKKQVAMSIFADLESKKTAETLMQETNGGSTTAESLAVKLTSSIQNRSISGLQKIHSEIVTHTLSGQKMYVSVYGVSSNSARQALAMQDRNYATNLIDIDSQQRLHGTKAGLDAAVASAHNSKNTYRVSQQEAMRNVRQQAAPQRQAIQAIQAVHQQRQPASRQQGARAGVYGGGAADSFDW